MSSKRGSGRGRPRPRARRPSVEEIGRDHQIVEGQRASDAHHPELGRVCDSRRHHGGGHCITFGGESDGDLRTLDALESGGEGVGVGRGEVDTLEGVDGNEVGQAEADRVSLRTRRDLDDDHIGDRQPFGLRATADHPTAEHIGVHASTGDLLAHPVDDEDVEVGERQPRLVGPRPLQQGRFFFCSDAGGRHEID